MKTPICDFVRKYANSGSVHLHMPGHKGASFLGFEELDITEISGADSLYEAKGIIAESEENASELFGCSTYYSTEGSSQCIKAMMYLALLHAKKQGLKPLVAAGRNAHKAFHSAAALLNVDVAWIYPENMSNYLSCNIGADDVKRFLQNSDQKPVAIYLTSPDYLGNVYDIRSIAQVCHENGLLLMVDNAHGAYLKFLNESMHPIDLGADICCDSAHKTLPVLTGGAYLHISDGFDRDISSHTRDALSLFGSTSPSYLILQSLDMANDYLEGYSLRLSAFLEELYKLKALFKAHGYDLYGNEPLKITMQTKAYGYTGEEFAEILSGHGLVCEFSDPDFVVLMFTPELRSEELERIARVLLSIPRRKAIDDTMPLFHKTKRVISLRDAALSLSESVPIDRALGRVCALTCNSCPPAVPIVASGERIDEQAIECFKYYGVKECKVIK